MANALASNAVTLVAGEDFLHVTTPAGLAEALALLATEEEIALDTETAPPRDPVRRAAFNNIYNLDKKGHLAAFDPHTAEVRLVQLRGRFTQPIVIDLWAFGPWGTPALAPLRTFFQTSGSTFLLHNAKFDLKQIFGTLGVWFDAGPVPDSGFKIFDTMQASILLANSVGLGKERGHRLLDVARDFLDLDLDKTEQLSDWGRPALSDEQLEYAALDVVHLHELKDLFFDGLAELGQAEPMHDDMAVLGPTARVEWCGVPLNLDIYRKVQEAARYEMPALLGKIGHYFQEQINQPLTLTYVEIEKPDGKIELKPYRLPWGNAKTGGKAGKAFLLSKSSMVLTMLQEMGLVMEDGKDLDNVQRATLQAFRETHPGVGMLIDYWQLVKQAEFDYKSYLHPLTGCVHPRFNAGGASTGRFSCLGGDTQVLTDRGPRALKDVWAGDRVKTRFGMRRVVRAPADVGVKPLFEVTLLEGTTLQATLDHPFLVNPSEGTFKRLVDLRPDDCVWVDTGLRHADGSSLLKGQQVTAVKPIGEATVYDIQVEGVSEFFANGIAVHNCTSPNLQQVPGKLTLKHPDGNRYNYRQCFEAPFGWLMCSADFSGQELAVMAAMSGDPVMIRILNEGGDLHSEAAAGMFNIDPKDAKQKKPGDPMERTYRDYGKIVMFSLAYGKTAEGFAKDWKITKEEAKKIIEGFESKFTVLAAWLRNHGLLAMTQNYSRLPNGAMRFMGGEGANDAAKTRMGSNFQIQGLASWMTRRAMVTLDREVQTTGIPLKLIGQIHDELLSMFRYRQGCPTSILYLDQDKATLALQQAMGEAKAAKDKVAEKQVETALEERKVLVHAACHIECAGEEHCALAYETLIGSHMKAAGDAFLKGLVPAGFSVATKRYWAH